MENLSKNVFLKNNRLTDDDIEKSLISWDELLGIGIDHFHKIDQLKETAELFARIIQRFEGVHSVRWRVKDPEHLMEKIIRKTQKDSATYNQDYDIITKDNYHEIITDLVGVRALHLFKDDCFTIDKQLVKTWNLKGEKVAYVRNGDESLNDLYEKSGFKVKKHNAGYRSIHYIFETQPLNRTVSTEVQVRTLFEEAWSEIDHNVRYPNFSDNEHVTYFLKIFNRLAGSADEMGSFVKELVTEIDSYNKTIEEMESEKEENLKEIDLLLTSLEESNGKIGEQEAVVKKLKSQIDKLSHNSQRSANNIVLNNTSFLVKETLKASEIAKRARELHLHNTKT